MAGDPHDAAGDALEGEEAALLVAPMLCQATAKVDRIETMVRAPGQFAPTVSSIDRTDQLSPCLS